MSGSLTPEQRRRLAEVFGDEAWQRHSGDDLPEPGEAHERSDDRFLREVPPHHG